MKMLSEYIDREFKCIRQIKNAIYYERLDRSTTSIPLGEGMTFRIKSEEMVMYPSRLIIHNDGKEKVSICSYTLRDELNYGLIEEIIGEIYGPERPYPSRIASIE